MFGNKYFITAVVAILVAIGVLAFGLAPISSRAASHREAPLIALDPTADISDFFMFRSYESGRGDSVVLIMNVIPGEEPSSGPNYWNFDPNVLYAFNIDNDGDGKADDVRFEFQFRNEFNAVPEALDFFLAYLGNVPPTDGSVVPPITTLDGPGSEGLGMRQRYTVTMIKDDDDDDHVKLGSDLIAVPSNVGPRTMPDYDALATQGIYDLGDGVRVFAGQRDDPFYIDLGAVFDTLNLRAPGVDMLSGFNVHTIAIEVPISILTKDGLGAADTGHPLIGAYASTSRRKVTVLRGPDGMQTRDGWVQVQRLANPLINEAIIPTELKDRWNALDPSKESRFQVYYEQPRLALALQLVLGLDAATGGLDGVDPPRADLGPPFDLVNLLLKYTSSDTKLSELLRLNVSVAPVSLSSQERLTALAGDAAGWPNGRRPIDDVTDVAVQVVGGPNYISIGAGDGVNSNEAVKPLPEAFPFLASPWDGRNRIHDNP